MTKLICVLGIPAILLVMDEGSWFPVSNLIGLFLLFAACLLVARLEAGRYYRPLRSFPYRRKRLSLISDLRPLTSDLRRAWR